MLVNKATGKPPTAAELEKIEQRATEILQSPHSSPKQIAWALNVAPPDFELVFWQSTREAAQQKRRF